MIELSPTPCNDKAVEKLSKLALTYINEDRTEGYKFALNRISNVHLHAQGPAGNVYYLRLDVLETKCHVRSSKPWKRCDVRPFMETQISGNCNTTILHTATGYSYLYSYDCTLVPDPPEKLQQICPACPVLLPIDSPRAVHAAGLTLYKFNTQSTLPSSLALQNITRASVQSGPVPATFVEYTVQECREGYVGMCVPTDNSGDPAGFCKGAVYGPIGQPDMDVSCEIFHPQGIDVFHDLTPPRPPMMPEVPIFVPNVPIIIPSYPTAPPPLLEEPQPQPFDPSILVDPTRIFPNPLSPIPTPYPQPQPPIPNPLSPTPIPLSPTPLSPTPTVRLPASLWSLRRLQSLQGFQTLSEELGAGVARPPFNFRYRPLRRRRQALVTAKPPHTPVFLAEFPSSPSPFRSCPGPSRYTTV
uniref:LOW QUALITY PROTEIN: alpha-2-HS-glycoprotein n=1 Tax=Oncorhynchus gorbuscha TaxID=8017 RepID=UPI001EAF7045|nr:LOW QUALITY PROTEIN: alpha-2-HS-glycoprotein [Oncorhynchus gorbuscha]